MCRDKMKEPLYSWEDATATFCVPRVRILFNVETSKPGIDVFWGDPATDQWIIYNMHVMSDATMDGVLMYYSIHCTARMPHNMLRRKYR